MPGLRHRQARNSTEGKKEKLSTETSALQVWVMIEGYEKLREELLLQDGKFGVVVEGGGPQKEAVKAMLDTWLSALYKIYDELSEEAFEVRSESNYSDYEDGYVSE